MANENLNKWTRTFKKVGAKAGSIGVDTLRNIAPGISGSVDSSIDVLRESRQFISRSKTQLQQYQRALSTTKMGKDSIGVLNSAFNDIKNGVFSLGKSSDDLYDSMDNFDNSLSSIDLSDSDPASIAMVESTKNMAIIGKTVTEGNVAAIEGMRNMTETLSNVTIKAAESSVGKLSNIALNGINQTNYYLNGINNRLDVINENIISLLDFHRNVTYQTNQAQLEYYSESSRMMQQMGEAVSEMQDYIKSQKELEKKKKTSDEGFDVSRGFDFKEYMKFVKKNFDKSALGTMSSMTSMGFSMMDMMGESPLSMILPMVTESLIPGKLKKSIKRFDKSFTSSIDTMLYNIGDMADSTDFLKSTIGELFGKKRNKLGKTNLGDFKKDTMGWNGIAQKTLVTVIPSYLANIEAALTKKESRHYDMDTGMFISKKDLAEEFKNNFRMTQENSMNEFAKELEKVMNNSLMSDSDRQSIRDLIDEVTYKQLMGTGGSRKEATRTIFESMNNKVSDTELRDVLMEWQSGMSNMISEMNNIMKVSGSKHESLFNEKGRSTSHLYNRGNISRHHKYTWNDDGQRIDITDYDESDPVYQQYLDEKESVNRGSQFKRNAYNRIRGALGLQQRQQRSRRGVSRGIDRAANQMFDIANGLDGHSRSNSQNSVGAASSQSTNRISSVNRMSRNLTEEANNMVDDASLDDVLSLSPAQIQADSRRVNRLIENDKATDNQSVLAKLVMSLQTNFLKPMVGGIFGKDGFFSKILNNDHVKKVKDVLFNEETGIFKEVTIYMKDQVAAIKHVFTGKSYTDSNGVTHAEDTNSVFDHFAKGYDFVFKNAMTHIFGEDYEKNETYNKYLKFFDFKGKRDKKRADRLAREEEEKQKTEIEEKKQSNITAAKGYYDDNHNFVTPEKHGAQIQKSINRHQKKLDKMKSITAQTVDSEKVLSDAVTYSADKIKSTTDKMTTAMFGDFADDKKTDQAVKSANKSFSDSIKEKLPKGLAIAGAGALGGAILGIGGTGLIGSLFLPTGVIGGAIVASGLAIASKSEGIKKFIFGEKDDDGKRMGGLISNKTQEFVKKNMPLIVGGGALGLLKNIVLGSSGGVLGTLIGGPLAGAAFSVGLGMLKQNDTIQNILFGKDNEDGSKTTKGFSKASDQFKKIMEKSGHFIKGGAKGLGIGLLSSAVVSQMGILGSALTLGGPIGMGLAGLGIGIASQTNKFNELLFGTKEFNENGEYKGRAGDGLLTRVKNLLVLNVFEPIKDTIQDKAIDFAIWTKKAIEFPFRAAFGPILDSISGIYKNVSDTVHDTFINVGKSVTKMMKIGIDKVFKPITSMMGKVAKGLGFAVDKGIKLSLLPITAPLKFLEIISVPKRAKARWEQNKTIISNFGTLLEDAKDKTDKARDAGEYGKGIRGKFNYIKGGFTNLREAWDGAHFASNDELHAEGKNHLRYMDLPYEKRMLKKKKKVIQEDRNAWRAINKERRTLLNDEQGGATVNYTDDEFKRVQKRFTDLGIDKKFISNNEDLNMFLTSRDDWKEKFLKPKQGEQSQEVVVNRIAKFGLPDSSETKVYRKKILDKFDLVTKEITKITAQQYLSSKNEFSLKELTSMNKRFSALGITWDDLGFDPTVLVNKADISDDDWMRLLYDAEEKGGFASGSFSIKEFMKWHRENKDEYKKYSDEVDAESAESASLNVLTDISESVRATAVAGMNQMAMDTGVGESDVERSTGMNVGSREFKINKIWKKKLAADAAKKREEEENKKVRSGTKELKDEEAGKAIIDPENATDKQKSSLFEKVGGFFSNMFGSIGSFITSKKGVALLTGGVVGAALFGEKAVGLVTKVWDTIVPPLVTQLKKAGTWIIENGPGLLDKMEDFVHKNIGAVTGFILGGLSRFARIAGDVFINIGKRAANLVAEKVIPGDWVPFPDIADETSKTRTFDDVAEAETDAVAENKNVYVDPNTGEAKILANDEDVNPETGEITKISSGNHLRGHTIATFTRQMTVGAGKKATRTMAKHGAGLAVKGTALGLKGLGYVSGVIPGLKLIKGIFKVAGSSVDATYKGVKSVSRFAKNQAAKKAAAVASKASDVDNVIARNAVSSLDDVAEGVAKTGKDQAVKGITKFLNKAKTKLLGFAKSDAVTKVISETKFVKMISTFIDSVSKKVKSLSTGAISKITEFIAEKTGKSTLKTGAAAGTAGLSLLVFGALDGISGALDAPYLFGVTSADVDGTMRTISAVMYVILGLPVVAYFDIVLEVFALITGKNPKQSFARGAYKLIKREDGANQLEEAAMRIQLETDKYNKANGTNLTTDAYLEKRNAGSGLLGSISKGWTHVFNRKKYNEKYDFSKYSVSDAEVQKELARANTETDNYDYATSSEQILVGLGPGRKMRSRLRYNKSIGYGSNTLMQGDSRWGNYPIGYFPDGSVSTMATGGCGPTALAMVANEVGYGASPVSVAQYAKNNGYIKDGGATSGLFTEGASRMGLRSTALNKSSLKTSLQHGESVIVSGKSTSSNSPYTEAGHIVKASGLDSNGNVIVDDPMRGRTSVNVNDLTSGMTNGWSYSVGYGPATFDKSIFNKSALNNSKGSPLLIKDTEVKLTAKDIASSDNVLNSYTKKKKQQEELKNKWNSRVKAAEKKVTSGGTKTYNPKLKELISKFDRECQTYMYYRKLAAGDSPVSQGINVEQTRDRLDKYYAEITKLDPSFKMTEEQSEAFNDIYIRTVDNPMNFSNRPTKLTNHQILRINEMISDFKNQGYKFTNVDANKLFLKGFVKTTNAGGLYIIYGGYEYKVPSKKQMKNGNKTMQLKTSVMYEKAKDALLSILKENYLNNLTKNPTVNNRTLTTDSQLRVKIDAGYKKNDEDILNFNTPDFYVGLNVCDLEGMIKIQPDLLEDKDIPMFAKVYEYYTQSPKYKNNKTYKFTLDELTSIAQAAGLDDFFGSFGEVNSYEFKNGFPFFRMADERWADIAWKNTKLRGSGDDISSLAMIASAFGKNIFSPKYIYENWLMNYPGWYNNRQGLNTANVFKDGGFNALKSTQVDGKRLKVSALKNISSIKSALRARKPVYMTGLKYKGSIFGGVKPLGTFSSKDADAYGTVVGVAANSTHMAINDPRTTADANGVFDIDMLSESVQNGSENIRLVKNAYSVANPDGSGLDGSVDLSAKSGGTSDFTPIDPKDGIWGMIAAIFKNFGAIGNHLLNSIGGDYTSIYSENPIEDDVADDAGMDESAYTLLDNFDSTTIGQISSTNGTSATSGPTAGVTNALGNTLSGAVNAAKTTTGIPSDYSTAIKNALKEKNKVKRAKKMKELSEMYKKNKFGIGGGKRDIAIGYGLGSGEKINPESIFEEMNAIAYAFQEQQFGGDYNAAKQAYYDQKKEAEQATVDGTTSTVGVDGTTPTVGISYDVNPSAYTVTTLSGDKKEFVDKVAPGAIKANEQYGVKASLTLAQGALESGWGRDAIGNNLFGIKAGGSWTGKTQTVSTTEYDSNNNAYTTTATFRDYNTIDESILDHAKLLLNDRYKGVLAAKNYKEACYAVKAAGYATDPNYPTKLINLIETNGFAAYDNMTSGNLNASNQVVGHGLGRHSKRRAIGYGASWLQIVQAVKQAIAGANVGYSQSNYITINVLGRTLGVRTDCSGFVSACCILYGALSSALSSSGFCNLQAMNGFTKLPWPGWESLIPGDILAVSGHVEIYAGKDTSGNNMVYNCGSTSSIKNPGMTYSSRSIYTYIWRPNETGAVASIAVNETTTTPATTSNTTDNSSSGSKIGGIWGSMANSLDSMSKVVTNSMNSFLGYGKGQNDPVAFFEDSLDGEIVSGYGNRKSVLGNEYHRGIDIGAASGRPILSPISGTVVASGTDVSGYGNYTMIQDKRGNNHLFAHMNKPVGYGVGTRITKNDIIGEVGATGRATGSHLHYEIRRNGNKYSTLNPMNYKYDKELGKSINISHHNMQSVDDIGYGTGNKDIHMYDPESKLNVDVNTKNVEDKLDSLINVMQAWADRDGKSSKGATNYSQVTNNNTTVYGEGKKQTSSTTKNSSPGIDIRSKSLESVHKAIAGK